MLHDSLRRYVPKEMHEAPVCSNIQNHIQSVIDQYTNPFQYKFNTVTTEASCGIISTDDFRQGAAAVAGSKP